MKIIKVVLSLVLLVFILKTNAFAVSVSITGVPTSIDESQDFQVTVNLTCSGCSDSYIRGVFYPSGTSYFGYTQDNNGNWSNASGSSCTTFYKISQSDISIGSWSGSIRFKPDKDNSYYNGPGEYSFKVGRYSYTSSCSSSPTWSDEKIIAITGPTPTPTPAPTSIPTQTPTNTPTPTLILTSTPTPTKKPILSSSPTGLPTPTIQTAVLGQTIQDLSPSTSSKKPDSKLSGNLLPKVFIVLGLVFIALCIGIISFPYIKNFKTPKDIND